MRAETLAERLTLTTVFLHGPTRGFRSRDWTNGMRDDFARLP